MLEVVTLGVIDLSSMMLAQCYNEDTGRTVSPDAARAQLMEFVAMALKDKLDS